MQLQDRIAIVTGASRGIGREIALGYARAGATVVLTARDQGRLAAVAEEIRTGGGAAAIKPLDVTDHAAINRVVDETIDEFGHLDVLCNNAGVSSAPGPVATVTPAAFAAVHAVNLIGLYACCHALLPHMIERGYGRIVNVSSGAAIMCNANGSAYASSKAAVNALTIAMAKEVRDHNVLVNAMSPGSVQTDMNPSADVLPEEAVPTAIWLAALPKNGPGGRFFRFMQELPMLPELDVEWSAR